MIRIAAIARKTFKDPRLEVLPEAAIAVFIYDRRVVVFDHRDEVIVRDVSHPRIIEMCHTVNPAAKTDAPAVGKADTSVAVQTDTTDIDAKADASEETEVQAFEETPEEDDDALGW